MKPIVVVLPVSRPDFHLAVKWLKWVQMIEPMPMWNLIVFVAKSVPLDRQLELSAITDRIPIWRCIIQKEEYERPELGYAAAANAMFRGGLEAAEFYYPEQAVLWCEADAIPMRASWVKEISEEYESCGKPFMGDFHADCEKPHMTGNAIYPPNWRELAPSLALLPGPDPREGWDSSCRLETVPQSHRSCRIQQVWLNPRFTDTEYSIGRIHPETALFHRCKDGTLIDVLAKRLGVPPIPLGPALAPPTAIGIHRARLGLSQPDDPDFKCEIMIVTFRRDADFLYFAVKSLQMYASGFSGITIVAPRTEKNLYGWVPKPIKVVFFDEEPGKGMLSHLIQKCRADEICPNADAILLMDADCMAWKQFSPVDYFPGNRALMVRERYEDIQNPNRKYWQGCVERAIGVKPTWETMVRHPGVHFREVFARTRKRVEHHTGMPFDQYVLSGPNTFPQSFVEFDTLGAVAIEEFSHKYSFVNYDRFRDGLECGVDPLDSWQYLYRKDRDCMVEWWSHGGIAGYEKLMNQIIRGEGPAVVKK